MNAVENNSVETSTTNPIEIAPNDVADNDDSLPVTVSQATVNSSPRPSVVSTGFLFSLLQASFIQHFNRSSYTSGKVLDFLLKHSRTWKVLENRYGPGKSWKLKFKVLESPGKLLPRDVIF